MLFTDRMGRAPVYFFHDHESLKKTCQAVAFFLSASTASRPMSRMISSTIFLISTSVTTSYHLVLKRRPN